MVCVWAIINDALGVVSRAGTTSTRSCVSKTTGKFRIFGLPDVNHVEATTTCYASHAYGHCISEARFFVNHDVVRACDLVVHHIGFKLDWGIRDVE